MPDLFFERMQEKREELPSTFVYDDFPNRVRRQIILIAQNFVNDNRSKPLVEKLREATGNYELADGEIRGPMGYWSYQRELFSFFEDTPSVDHALSVLELIGRVLFRNNKDAFDRVNVRLLRAGIGWKLTEHGLIQIEDEAFFENVTAPCLSALGRKGYRQAYGHFLDAYKCLKEGEFIEALTNCGRAFESIVKTRLVSLVNNVDHKNWNALKPLLKEHMSIPPYMESYLNQLLGVMEGVPTARNKDGGHGKSEDVHVVADENFIRFIINQTAANILFIAEAEFR